MASEPTIELEPEELCPYMLITKHMNCCVAKEFCSYKTIYNVMAIKMDDSYVMLPTCTKYSQLWSDELELLVEREKNDV